MAKFYGVIGYAEFTETKPGVHEEVVTERTYIGDILSNNRRLESSGQVNDNITISNRISIIADPFAYEKFHTMRYAIYLGTKWKITNVEVQYPRLILTLGGVYNAET